MIGPAGTLVPSANPPSVKTVQDAMFQRRIGSSGLGEFGDLRRLVPDPDDPEKKPSGSLKKPGAPKSSSPLPKPGAPTTTPPTTPRSPSGPPRVRGLAPLTPPKPKMGVGKGLGSIAALIQAASARNEFTRLDDPEKFIDQRVDQLDPKLTLNNILTAMDPTTLVTTFGSQMQRQNDKLQAEQDRQNNAIRQRGLQQRASKKAEQSIMGSGAPELVADLVRRINRDGFSGSQAIQSGFRRESEAIMHGDLRFGDVPFAGFQQGLDMLRSNMSLALGDINRAGGKGLMARRALDSLDGKESVKVDKFLQQRLQDLGQAVPAEGVTLEGRQLENLKETLAFLGRAAETEKGMIAAKELIRLETALKATNAIFETNFDLSQLRVERETGQFLNPLQFFQRAGNADSFRDIAATALENEKANRLRNQFNPELIRQRQGEFEADLGPQVDMIQAVADSAGTALGGAVQNTVTRVLDNFTKLGGQRGVQNALRTQASGGLLDSETRQALQELQQALKEQAAVLREASVRAGVGRTGIDQRTPALAEQANQAELSRLQLFDPTNQRIGTLQQEIKKSKEAAQQDQVAEKMFGEQFANRARGIRNITEKATALGEEIIRDYGSSAASMAANQGLSLKEIAEARAAAENQARAATESTIHHAGVFGIDDPLTLNASTGDTRMIEMARLMQQRMALRLQQEKANDPRMAELRGQLDPETFANVQRRRRALQSGQLTPANRAIVEEKQREDLKGVNLSPSLNNAQKQNLRNNPFVVAPEKAVELSAAIQANTAAVIAKNEADATMQQQQQQQEQQAAATNNINSTASVNLAVSVDKGLKELEDKIIAAAKTELAKDFRRVGLESAAKAMETSLPQIQS